MSYIVLNGVKSTLIQGLLISSLPPITKPSIRTTIETIDGRDGDIVSKLGYSAYNKEMTIGLFGDYDIDEVINYFNSEGTVIFSNEPDKFYQYQILEQIDFEKLINFKTATVTFHVQPFKYSAVDDKVTLDQAMFHLKSYEDTKNGVTVKVVDGELSFVGTATKDTEFYVPIEPMVVKETHTQIGTEVYIMGALGGAIGVGIKGEFLFRIISSTPTDADSLGGRYYAVAPGSITMEQYKDTVEKVYKYLWIKVSSGQEFTASFKPIISVSNRNLFFEDVVYINSGNVESKPIFKIIGTGDNEGFALWINGKFAFEVTFHTALDEVVVDTQTMNAYSGDTLRNRDIMGDLSKVSFKTGKNTVRVYYHSTGVTIDTFTVERESRWI